MDEVKRLPVLGEKFPEFTVKTTHGVMKLPDAYKGKWFVLLATLEILLLYAQLNL